MCAGQTHGILNLANRMITDHNQAMEALKQKFAAEAAQDVANAIVPLQQALQRLGELAISESSTFKTRSEEVLQRVRAALPVLEGLKTAFETSSRLES